MDTKIKRSQAEKVRRRVEFHLRPLGFSRTKTSFWIRQRGPVIEFIHLHLFSYIPAFRIHLGIRVLNDTCEAAVLNGPCCRDSDGPAFDETSESIPSCALGVLRYCQDTGLPWFTKWQDPHDLVLAPDSPLRQSERAALDAALKGRGDPNHEGRSSAILGVA